MALRVIAGELAGRRLKAPPGLATRPTSAKLREAIFSILGDVTGARVLDLFAGSGALGIEALSRGARSALFVEQGRGAAAVLRGNLAGCGLGSDRARLRFGDARALLESAKRRSEPYDLIFIDPPYEQALRWEPALQAAIPSLLAGGGRVIVECDRRSPIALELPVVVRRRYGGTLLSIHRSDQQMTDTDVATSPATAGAGRAGGRSIAICPGSYDPVTNGHLDIIQRASRLWDEVVVGVVNHPVRKGKTLFSPEERISFIEEATGAFGNVRVELFSTLVVELAQRVGGRVIVKGLRAISDFEYELEMNQLNRQQAPDVESVYLMASPQYSFLSSSGVKELAIFGGAIDNLVPPRVAIRLQEELAR